jgi:hypothetical protein
MCDWAQTFSSLLVTLARGTLARETTNAIETTIVPQTSRLVDHSTEGEVDVVIISLPDALSFVSLLTHAINVVDLTYGPTKLRRIQHDSLIIR